MDKEITVWCVKYALTTGIYELKGRIAPDGYFSERSGFNSKIGHFLSKNDYRLTLKDARSAAEELRKRKIKSLERQLAKVMTQKIAVKSLLDCGLPPTTGEVAA